jgi:hypothetical protein
MNRVEVEIYRFFQAEERVCAYLPESNPQTRTLAKCPKNKHEDQSGEVIANVKEA